MGADRGGRVVPPGCSNSGPRAIFEVYKAAKKQPSWRMGHLAMVVPPSRACRGLGLAPRGNLGTRGHLPGSCKVALMGQRRLGSGSRGWKSSVSPSLCLTLRRRKVNPVPGTLVGCSGRFGAGVCFRPRHQHPQGPCFLLQPLLLIWHSSGGWGRIQCFGLVLGAQGAGARGHAAAPRHGGRPTSSGGSGVWSFPRRCSTRRGFSLQLSATWVSGFGSEQRLGFVS